MHPINLCCFWWRQKTNINKITYKLWLIQIIYKLASIVVNQIYNAIHVINKWIVNLTIKCLNFSWSAFFDIQHVELINLISVLTSCFCTLFASRQVYIKLNKRKLENLKLFHFSVITYTKMPSLYVCLIFIRHFWTKYLCSLFFLFIYTLFFILLPVLCCSFRIYALVFL